MSKSVFISANNGEIEVAIGPGNTVGSAGTPEALSKLLDDHNISGDCHFSSSMDFADEYGFAHYDGAKVLWEQMNEFRMSFGSEEAEDYRAKVRG